jgi:3-dehydroquinate dehydratase-2|tara:strand:- start:74 stop:454 length:381 start_codon:yes stop_codon:yes gene_type:complete
LDHYGTTSYEELKNIVISKAEELNMNIEIYQSNIEGEIVDFIQDASKLENSWIVINPGAYTHTSIAIRDALLVYTQSNKVLEVHISDINQREGYRKINLISDICEKSIIGNGIEGYVQALEYVDGQ